MPNKPQQDKADKSQYAGKAYLDYEEACHYLGIKKVTLHKYMATLNIKGKKFELKRKHFLSIEDVECMERAISEPWMISDLKKKSEDVA